MKYILVLLVILFAIWLWRHNRRSELDETKASRARPSSALQRPAPLPPQHMVVCLHCGVHLPINEAIAGKSSAEYYCSHEHRQAHEAHQ
jgi:uncharacterized protein